MRHKYLMLTLLVLASAYSCKQDTIIEPIHDLTGIWQDAGQSTNGNSARLEMSFETDSSFVQLISLYGVYDDQSGKDLSAWFKLEGEVNLQGAAVSFTVNRYTWWDHQYGSEPVEETYFGQLYSNCTYRLNNETGLLNLQYTPNPSLPSQITNITLTRTE